MERKFKRELETASTQLKEQVASLYVATILGRDAPEGTKPITKEETRGRMLEFFMKARAGWSDRLAIEGGNKPIPVTYHPFRGEIGL